MEDNILGFLGLCKRAGALVTGEEAVGGAARSGDAKLILLASDAGGSVTKSAARYSENFRVVLVHLPYTKDELGDRLGGRVSAIISINDKNFAKSLLDKLAKADESYITAREALAERLKSRKERRKNIQN